MEENGEDSHAMQTEENTEDLKESHDAEEGAELEDGQKNGKASSKKRGRKKLSSGGQATPKKSESPKKPESKEPITPASDRPARERKSIDRFADTVEKEKEKPKEFKIEQGAGICLKDIPNVVFKLSKRKTSDESVQLLHKFLFNKRVKPQQVKSNILQFSGCVWGPNEEKKSKMKERLEKCVKDSLYQVCDLLDLKNVTKSTKKEDLVLRLLEFLDSPHKTTDTLVQEEAQKLREKKRKKTPVKGKKKKSSSQTPRKRQKREADEDTEQGVDEDEENEEDAQEEPEEEPEEVVPVKKKKSIKIKEPSRDAKPSSAKKQSKKSAKKSSASEDGEEEPEGPAAEPEEPEEAPEEPKRKRAKNKKYEDDVAPAPKSPKKAVEKPEAASKSPKKSAQKSVKKKSVYEPGDEDLDDEVKEVKSKPLSKVSKKPPPKEAPTPVVSPSKEKKKEGTGSAKVSHKKKKKEEQQEDAPPSKVPKKARGASNSDAKVDIKSDSIPPDEDLRAAICELLRDADFSTVTFTDVVKQLGAKFDVDLSQNKAHVKNLIQEEISKIVDEDDGEGDNDDEEAGIHTPEKKEKESIAEV